MLLPIEENLNRLPERGEAERREKMKIYLHRLEKLVNPVMEKLLTSELNKKNQELVKYQILTGGKRLRPALTIISSLLVGGKLKDVIYPAAGLEILHNYSLIIDDIIDNGLIRRGKPTILFKFGKSIAECIGVCYSATLFQVVQHSKNPVKMSEIIARTSKNLIEGEILDILFEQAGRKKEPYVVKNRYWKISEKDYFEMVGKKTAALFETCFEVGGIYAKAKEKEIEALKNYGFNLGMAFQIQDDILDIFGQEEILGKKVGKDIIERKGGNIVILLAFKASPDKKGKILKILRKKIIGDKDIKEVLKLINQTNARQKAIELAKSFVQKAKENLNSLPKNKWNNLLREIADFVIKREK